MLLMNLESRPVVFEDIGRQVLATGHRKRPEYFISEIGKFKFFWIRYNKLFFTEKVSKDDIVAVARSLLSSQPSVAARGDIRKLPSLDYIQQGLIDSDGRMPGSRKLSIFR